jgi:hypothetical protein
MDLKVLTVCRDRELGPLLGNLIEEECARTHVVWPRHVRTEAEALAALAQARFDLVVTEGNISLNAESPLNPEEFRGFSVAGHAAQRRIPTVVLIPAADNRLLARARDLPLC